MANRKKLGEILIEQGAATLDALKKGLSLQRQRGGRLGRTLVENKAITEAQLARALAAQSRMPLAKMKEDTSASITDLVPLQLCQKHQAIAFGVRAAGDVQTVYVALADPYDTAAMDAIRAQVSGAVKFALAPASDIARAVARASAQRGAAASREAAPPRVSPAAAVPLPAPSPQPVPLPAPAQSHVPLPAPEPQRVPLPAPEAPRPVEGRPAQDEGGAALDALLGLPPRPLPPEAPPPATHAVEDLDDLFDGGTGSAAPPPVQGGITFETEADVFDLSTQAEAVGAYSAQVASSAPPMEPEGRPQTGFLLGEALLDAGAAPEPLSLDLGPQLDAPGDLDIPDAVLPGIELTPEEMAQDAANEWPPEASPWAEEPRSAPYAFEPPADPAGAPSPEAPAFGGLPTAVEDQDPFTEPTRQFDLTMLSAKLRGGEPVGGGAVAAAAPAAAPSDSARRDDAFDLFVADEAPSSAPGGASESLGSTPLPETAFEEPGTEEGWKEEGEPASLPAAKPAVALPDLESLRAELSAYSTEHGAEAVPSSADAPGAGNGEADLAALGPLGLELGEVPPSEPAARPPEGTRAEVSFQPPDSPAKSIALPPPPDLRPVSLAFESSPAPANLAASAAPGDPIEISSDEIIDVEPDGLGPASPPGPAPEAEGAAAPEPSLFDADAIASFGGALGASAAPQAGDSGDSGASAPTGEAAQVGLPVVPRSSGPSLIPSFPLSGGAVSAQADVLENLRRIASSGSLAAGMTAYEPDRLGHALAKLLTARGVVSGVDLSGMLASPADQLSLQLVRALLARAMLTPDDLVSMLTTPQERLNAAVLTRLLERGSVAADEFLGAL